MSLLALHMFEISFQFLDNLLRENGGLTSTGVWLTDDGELISFPIFMGEKRAKTQTRPCHSVCGFGSMSKRRRLWNFLKRKKLDQEPEGSKLHR